MPRAAAASFSGLRRDCNPAFRLAPHPVPHAETICVAGHSSYLKVTCRSGHLHAHWTCECGSAGIVSPYGSIEAALEGAYAAVGRHHLDRHAQSSDAASALKHLLPA